MKLWKKLTGTIIVIAVGVIAILLTLTLAKPIPANPVPTKPIPANPIPTNPIPAKPIPANPVPTNPVQPDIGKAIQCSANSVTNSSDDVFRYLGNNKIARYPNPTVASFVDPIWGSASRIDCKGLTRANDVLGGTEYSTAVFQCPVVTGTVIYGTRPNKIITVPIKPGSTSMLMSNPTFGTDPNPNILKNWGAYYTC